MTQEDRNRVKNFNERMEALRDVFDSILQILMDQVDYWACQYDLDVVVIDSAYTSQQISGGRRVTYTPVTDAINALRNHRSYIGDTDCMIWTKEDGWI